MEKLNRLSTSMWTLIDGNRNEAEFNDTTNMFLRDSLKHEKSQWAVLENAVPRIGQTSLRKQLKLTFGFHVRRE